MDAEAAMEIGEIRPGYGNMAIRGLRVEKGYGRLLAFARAGSVEIGWLPVVDVSHWLYNHFICWIFSTDTKIHQSSYYAWTTSRCQS